MTAALTAHHGTHHSSLPLVSGLCLARAGHDDGYTAASAYARRCAGEHVFEVEVDLACLEVLEVSVDAAELLRRGGDYPGDHQSERDAFVAQGVDALAYADEVLGISHQTIRLLSARALGAVTVTGVYDPA